MRVRIHRGTEQIGGSCIELESGGQRLVLDLGRPLDAPKDALVPLPDVAGLEEADDTLLGIILSHGHQDHWGLIPQVREDVPVYLGEAAHRILRDAAFFGAGDYDVKPAGFLRDRQRFSIGPFVITPYLNDHSAFDAYALLIEADHERLFYTGDIRGHGRKAAIFEKLLRKPPRNVDALLMEGTNIPASAEIPTVGSSELDVEKRLAKTFQECRGPVLLATSAQNIDRMVSIYKAAKASGRLLVVDLYTASVAAATGLRSIPQAGFPGYRVWVPQRQRVRVKTSGEFERISSLRTARLFPESFKQIASQAVFLFRMGLAPELERALDLREACLVWSLWSGYLSPPHDRGLRPFLTRHGIKPECIHSSGHAWVADLKRLLASIKPRYLVPIHTFGGDRYADVFSKQAAVSRQSDGVWWEVAA
jgi:ribonuclease J